MAVSRLRAAVAAQQSYQGPIAGGTQERDTIQAVIESLPFTAAFWASDAQWDHPADNGVVTSWRDMGTEGENATNTGDVFYRATTAAFNDRPTVQGGGGLLQTGNWSGTLAQRYALFVFGSIAGSSQTLVAGNDGTNLLRFFRRAAAGQFSLDCNAGTTTAFDPGDTDTHRFIVDANGASSQLTVDGVSGGTISPGTAGIDGLTLFDKFDGGTATTGHIGFVGAMTFTNYFTNLLAVAHLLNLLDDYYGL